MVTLGGRNSIIQSHGIVLDKLISFAVLSK
jgi:hypothetical protein